MWRSAFATHGLALTAVALACRSALGAEVDPLLASQARERGVVESLIVLPDQAAPSLTPLDANADYKIHRRALVDALRSRATAQQADLRQWLDTRGIEYHAYWISNLVWARLSSADLSALAQRRDVAKVATNPQIPMHLPQQTAALQIPDAVEAIGWGVAKINAPLVWAAGFNGQGVVIAGEDTGYQWNHPALINHYRGWDGAQADHNYNWHDAIHTNGGANVCGVDSPAPCDDDGHGTHTAGTFVGGDGGSNQIGVAPGSKWIGCRNMDAGAGTPARYIECMQWLLAPTDLADANPNPDLAPDIVSNSWSCPPSEGCTVGNEIQGAVNAVVAGGIFFAAAAGNTNATHTNACGQINEAPAIYDASFVVGATGTADGLANFSLRGPVADSSLIRPDISAPGVSVCSSIPTNSYSCAYSGTSMATPHVAGAAALVLSINPALKGHPDQIAQILRATAARTGVTDPIAQTCGGTLASQWPNNMLGYGRVDAYAAAVMADTLFKDGFDGAAAN
ncbi:MAG: S8 family serine peptidase [Pseudomonadota bacterium]|nr:S8 family serine peptidase [Pseudomonadota bacterium]